jgi:hypothetical protein
MTDVGLLLGLRFAGWSGPPDLALVLPAKRLTQTARATGPFVLGCYKDATKS